MVHCGVPGGRFTAGGSRCGENTVCMMKPLSSGTFAGKNFYGHKWQNVYLLTFALLGRNQEKVADSAVKNAGKCLPLSRGCAMISYV